MPMHDQDLRACLLLANSGDEAAYRRFFLSLLPVLRKLARNAVSRTNLPTADAEDIVQETLIALHQKRHTYDPAQPIGPWIRGIARHKLLDAFRKRRLLHVPITDFEDIIPCPSPEPGMNMAEVIRLATTLPDRQRDAVVAIAEGFTGRTAAEHVAMSEGAFRVALHRGIGRLARLVER